MGKLATIIVLMMTSIAIVPPIAYVLDFSGSEFFPKVFNIIFFLTFTFIGILMPYSFEKMPKEVGIISFFMAGWFLCMFFYEISNFFVSESKLASPSDLYIWIKWALCFFLGVTLIIIKEVVKKWN